MNETNIALSENEILRIEIALEHEESRFQDQMTNSAFGFYWSQMLNEIRSAKAKITKAKWDAIAMRSLQQEKEDALSDTPEPEEEGV